MSFAEKLKKKGNSLERLRTELNKLGAGKKFEDPDAGKYWNYTKDAAGNAFAIIRFLPAPEGEDLPFVQTKTFGFQGPTGQWYIENSRLAINEPDPVAEYNSKLWNSTTDENSPERQQARAQGQRKRFVSNIYVIKDSGKPENEGKVFLYSYPKKIYDKLNDAMNPAFEDEDPIDPFDMLEGANFRLKVSSGSQGWPNYDKSEFDTKSALLDGDMEKLEAVYNAEHSLQELFHPSRYKSYEALQARLHAVLGITGDGASAPARTNAAPTAEKEYEPELDYGSKLKSEEATSHAVADEEDDDDLAFFKNLAKG